MSYDAQKMMKIAPVYRMLSSDEQLMSVVFSDKVKSPVSGIHAACVKEEADVRGVFKAFVTENGFAPKILVVEGEGFFAAGSSKKAADALAEVYIAAAQGKTPDEGFFSAQSMREASLTGRVASKITIITGSAQGFGRGIAEEMAKEGAYIVVADLNEDGAKAFAGELCQQYGEGRAIAIKVNVADEDSVAAMIRETVLCYGGLDIFVNNAGIVKAGSLEEMDKRSFELTTAVNYTAYFLCTKYAVAPMKLQHSVKNDYMMDIIEINSKSGLAGSNRNFAYAGSKFGGIGLTQSFALELIPDNIKVNAICPGNFFEGPLWSDPERGLFVQYLNSGKVPGAKTIEDVKRFYEAKVPMNRGCRTIDVARAIFYIVEQEYETGQAVPVTGGQEMLK